MTRPRSTPAAKKSKKTEARPKREERKNIGLKTKTLVLTESGYRCAVPTCRQILLLDLHHIYQVKDGGGDDATNLIALCPTCHALYHREDISTDSIYAWKAMLISIGRAFDVQTIDKLMFLASLQKDELIVSGDGLLHFDRIIAANFATFELKANNKYQLVSYTINISEKGKMLVSAWQSGVLANIEKAVTGTI